MKPSRLITSLVVACLFAGFTRAGELTLDARALMDRAVTENVRLAADNLSIELVRGDLIEDDGPAAGYSYKPNEEKLAPDVRIKKELIVTGPPAAATLLVGAGDNAQLQFEINGRPAELTRRDMPEGKWSAYDVPPTLLRDGKNEVVIGGVGAVWIARDDEYAAGSADRQSHPNRSAKSMDGGKSWDYDRLGTRNDVDGEYNLVFLQACESFGLVGRAVSIGPGGLHDKPRRGGHEVVELWSNDFAKWIYVDGQFAWYAVDDKTNAPLSLLELRERQLAMLRPASPASAGGSSPFPPIRIVKPGDVPARANEDRSSLTEPRNLPFGELRMIPRSNFLAQLAPLPLNEGMRGWFWTGHHVWTDDALPASLIYSHLVHTPANWEWTLNTIHYTLEATPTPGEVRVDLATHTPGLAKMLASVDGAAERPVESGFVWTLNKGKNRLDLCPTNVAGRRSVKTWAVIEN